MAELTDKQARDYREGKVELRTLLGMTPEYVQLLRGRAQFYLDGKHHERALIMLEMLEELDRTDTLPTLLAISTLLELGRSDAAEEKVTALLTRTPNDPDALVAKAELQIAVGELAPAAATLAKVVEADPQAKTSAGKRARVVAQRAHERVEGAR